MRLEKKGDSSWYSLKYCLLFRNNKIADVDGYIWEKGTRRLYIYIFVIILLIKFLICQTMA